MSIAIERLIAELKELSSDERGRLVEHWNASQHSDAASRHAPDTEMAERPSEIDRGAA